MKAETLGRIDAALRRLEAGAYGDCIECARRSRANASAPPFAVRCTTCEDARERGLASREANPATAGPTCLSMPSNDGHPIPRLTRLEGGR